MLKNVYLNENLLFKNGRVSKYAMAIIASFNKLYVSHEVSSNSYVLGDAGKGYGIEKYPSHRFWRGKKLKPMLILIHFALGNIT